MTTDEQVAMKRLEAAIIAPRQKYRIRDIRIEFARYKEALKVPWWKRIFSKPDVESEGE